MTEDDRVCVLAGFAIPIVSASEQAAVDAAVHRAYGKMLEKVRPADEPMIVEPVKPLSAPGA